MTTALSASLTLGACEQPAPPPGALPAPVSRPAPPPAPERARTSAPAPEPSGRAPAESTRSARPGCRVVSVEGRVLLGARAVAPGAPIGPEEWLALEAGSKTWIRHPGSGRELGLSGPGSAAPCWRGEEIALLDGATAESSAGAGARPGAEALIATPVGSVRWGQANLAVRPGRGTLALEVETGEAWLAPSAGEPEGVTPRPLGAGRRVTLRASARDLDPEQRVVGCERAAERAAELAGSVLAARAAKKALGERAAAHVRARRAARLACSVAAAAAGPGASGRDLHARIQRADELWRGVPGGTDPARK